MPSSDNHKQLVGAKDRGCHCYVNFWVGYSSPRVHVKSSPLLSAFVWSVRVCPSYAHSSSLCMLSAFSDEMYPFDCPFSFSQLLPIPIRFPIINLSRVKISCIGKSMVTPNPISCTEEVRSASQSPPRSTTIYRHGTPRPSINPVNPHLISESPKQHGCVAPFNR